MTCDGILGHLFGHNYEPRYDTTNEVLQPIPDGVLLHAQDHYKASIVESFKTSDRKYHYDICTRCGDIKNYIDYGEAVA